MRKRLDIAGFKFGRTTAIKVSQITNKQGKLLWDLACECGSKHTGSASDLKRGNILSCGCWRRKATIKRNTTHGKTKDRAYNTWGHIKARCLNPKNKAYYNYGGRGITICKEWENNFETFYRDMGDPREGMSIERIDNSKGYYKKNCKWATRRDQSRNKRSNRIVNLFGMSANLCYWAELYEIGGSTLSYRLKKGWVDYDAVTRPVRIKNVN